MRREGTVWLNPTHPNYERWLRGRNAAGNRAQVVSKIVSAHKICKRLNILDLGSGEGGTSSLFADSNYVVSYDISFLRLKRQKEKYRTYKLINGDARFLPFGDSTFDLIILQDVIEHIENPYFLIEELSRVLNKDGILYLSTPNKFSILNIISDPHWGIPFLSLLKRNSVKKYFLRFFRRNDYSRDDAAELLSLQQLKKLFHAYNMQLKTTEIVHILSEDPGGILWSSFHLFLYNAVRKSGSFLILKRMSNNRSGLMNNFFTPTFYIVLTGTDS